MMVGKIYCINLNRRTDRWKAIQREFLREGLHVERFAAVDSRDFKATYSCDNNNNACTLSHLSLIIRAKFLGLGSVMIFEDDAVLSRKFKAQLTECLNELPADWNMLYLGASHKEEPLKLTRRIYRVQKSFCSHAYILNANMFDTMIENFQNFDQPCDCFYTVLQRNHNMYICNPPLAWQRGGYSDIMQKEMHYDWIRKPL